MSTHKAKMIEVENVNHPGRVKRLEADMYEAMKRAFLKILPKTSPGLTVEEIQQCVIAHLPEELFPGGSKAGWWRRPFSLIWRRKVLLRGRKPSDSACTRHHVDCRSAPCHACR